MIASKRSSLGVRTTSDRFGQVVGPRKHGAVSPTAYGSLAAWYDVSLPASTTSSDVRIDSSNRVSLVADKSGNSAVNCLCLNAASGNYASVPDRAEYAFTTQFRVEIDLALVSWAPGNTWVCSQETNVGGSKAWDLVIGTTTINLRVSSNGSGYNDNAVNHGTPFSAHARGQLRADFTGDNGAGARSVSYYKRATDSDSWTLIGTATSGPTVSLYDSSAAICVGNNAGGSGGVNGRIYRFKLYSDTAGTTLVLNEDFSLPAKLATSFTESSSNAATVTINSSGDLGARISGERDLVQLTAAKQPIYLQHSGTNYAYTAGISGSYYSTPDSAAVSVTGDLELVARITMADYTPSSPQVIIAKRSGSSGEFAWRIETTGRPYLFWYEGGVSKDATATAAPAATDGTTYWFRVTRAFSGGSATVKHYFAADNGTNTAPSSWTQIGADVTVASTSGATDTAIAVTVAAQATGDGNLVGRVHRAQVLNGIGGTVVADFNPALYSSGTTFTASTGEVWTLNGGSTIVTRTCLYFDGSDDYMRSALFSMNTYGVNTTGYLAGSNVSWTDTRALMDFSTTSTGQIQLRQSGSTPTLKLSVASGTDATNSGLALQTTGVLSFGTTNGDGPTFLRVNRGTAGAGVHSNVTIGGVCLGARWASTAADRCSNITTSGICIYSAAHDVNTQNRLVQYLGNKWGISV